MASSYPSISLRPSTLPATQRCCLRCQSWIYRRTCTTGWCRSSVITYAHRTVYNGEVSSTKSISASIVQGSSIGPASYAVTAADLRPLHADNSLVKYADDTYLVIPATHADTRVAELGHIAAWAADNNLRLNKTKTREVVFYDNRRRHRIQPPPPLPDMTRGTIRSASRSPTRCRHLTTSAASSATVHSRCMQFTASAAA